MIYISTSCVKAKTIKEAVNTLLSKGFKNIELSGGTEYYPDLENDLYIIKQNTNVNFLLHNYFPPPKSHFVLNLASLNDEIYDKSIEQYKRALDLSNRLDSKKFGLHAGFLIDPRINELGKSINNQIMYDRSKSIDRFCSGVELLSSYTSETEIYVENNVFSDANKKIFQSNPFLFTDYEGYKELSKNLEFKVLLDVAHLKVSCKSLSISFIDELNKLASIADYIHISDNDALSDSNQYLSKESQMYEALSNINFDEKILTLEIYENFEKIIKSYDLLSKTN
jgi:sugar phosphate isomerase/epimerase